MKKGLIILIIVIVSAIASWYFFLRQPAEPAPVAVEPATALQEAAESVTNSIASSVSAVTVPNATEKIANETNPVEKTNPFSDLKVNPFE